MSNKAYLFQSFQEDIPYPKIRLVGKPLNSGNNWTRLVANFARKILFYLDPLGEREETFSNISRMWT